jgi:intein/homing endonuclease
LSLEEALGYHGLTRETVTAEMIRWTDSIRLESPTLYDAITYDPPEIKRRMGIKIWDFAFSTGMTTDYPVRRGWNSFMGVRELVQNALDIEERLFGYEGISVKIWVDELGLHVADRGPGITYDAFKLGGSDKVCHERGFYGEGLKVAMAFFVHIGQPIYVFNRRGQVFKAVVSPGTGLVIIAMGRANPVTGTEAVVYGYRPDVESVRRIIFQEWMKEPNFYIVSKTMRMTDACRFNKPHFIISHVDKKSNVDFLWVRDISVNKLSALTRHPSIFGYNIWWCVPQGTIILGENKPIEDHKPHDVVIGADGKLEVKKVFARPYVGKLIEIKGLGVLPVTVTPEHPVLIVKGERKAGRTIKFSEPLWKHADEVVPFPKHSSSNTRGLTTWDYLCIPKVKGDESPTELDLSKYTTEHGRRVIKGFGRGFVLPLNEDVAWVLGAFVAEGRADEHQVVFYLGKHEKEFAERISLIFKALGYNPLIYEAKTDLRVKICSVLLTRALRDWCGRRAKTKKVPDFILFHGNEKIIRAFLKGYLKGDGFEGLTIKKNKGFRFVTFSTASIVLAQQLQLLAIRLGFFFALRVEDNQYVGFCFFKERVRRRWKTLRDFIIVPVVQKAERDYSGVVYNLQTANNTFLLSNVIVHNCTLEPNRVAVSSMPELAKEVALSFTPEAVEELLNRVVSNSSIKRDLFEVEDVNWWYAGDEVREKVAAWVKERNYGWTDNERAIDWALYLGAKPLIVPYTMTELFGRAQTLEDVIIVKGMERIEIAEGSVVSRENLTLKEACYLRGAEIILTDIHISLVGVDKPMPAVLVAEKMDAAGTATADRIYIHRDSLYSSDEALRTALHEYGHYYGRRTYREARDLSEAFERSLTTIAAEAARISAEARQAYDRAVSGAWGAKAHEWKAGRYRRIDPLSIRLNEALRLQLQRLFNIPEARVNFSRDIRYRIDESPPLMVTVSLSKTDEEIIMRGVYLELGYTHYTSEHYIGDILTWRIPYPRLDLYMAAAERTLKRIEAEKTAEPTRTHIIFIYNPANDEYDVWRSLRRRM